MRPIPYKNPRRKTSKRIGKPIPKPKAKPRLDISKSDISQTRLDILETQKWVSNHFLESSKILLGIEAGIDDAVEFLNATLPVEISSSSTERMTRIVQEIFELKFIEDFCAQHKVQKSTIHRILELHYAPKEKKSPIEELLAKKRPPAK